MESVDLLTSVSLFEDVPEEQRHAIGEISELVECSRGELVFGEGDQAENIYILLSGKIAIRIRLTSRPESISVSVINKPFQSFGWSGVVAPFYYTASALCETDCQLLAIPGEPLIDVLRQDPLSGFEVMMQISQVISSRLRNSRAVLLRTL